MNVSEHLLVLVSIIVGLAITSLLASVRQVVRARVRLHWLPLAWAMVLFLTLVQAWWAYFVIVQSELWASNFFAFLFFLLGPVVMYLASSSLLPDPTEMDDTKSLLAYYFEGRAWVFGLLALHSVLVIVGEAMRDHPIRSSTNAFRLVILLLLISLAWSKSVRYHAAATATGLSLFLLFVFRFTLQLAR